MQFDNVIYQSNYLASSVVRELVSGIASHKIFLFKNYLQRSSANDDAPPISCEFASETPVDLKNFCDTEPDQLVLFDKISNLLPAENICKELSKTILTMEQWEKSAFQMVQDFHIYGGSRGIHLSVTSSKKKQKWQLQWRCLNRGEFFRRNDIETRLHIVNNFLMNVTQSLGLDALKAQANGKFLTCAEQRHSRISIVDPAAAFGESIERLIVEVTFSRDELENLLAGISEFFKEFETEARIAANHSQPLKQYQRWIGEFKFEPCCYAYMLNGPVNEEVVDYLSGVSDTVPAGFVPCAKYSVEPKGTHLGFVSLSCNFSDDGARVILSARTAASIEDFCDAAGLNRHFGSDAVAYS